MGKEILIAMNKHISLIQESKEMLLQQGVEKLKIIGFANVNLDNIMTDDIYQLYFLSFLKNSSSPQNKNELLAIKELKALINKLF
ncbi:hypothetical protein [Formosa sp. PL04]|uniref:hypothetical protein n=1 Tax=Formosa sp. PL04 TaxID=3081755 RepID=UPI00298206A5|nr:hypothetical protein [Formosa sp. PL04]MDW5290208.1 hypothetical protein [Formosa sp. PL04]